MMNNEWDGSDYNLIEIMSPHFLEGTEKECKGNRRREIARRRGAPYRTQYKQAPWP
jgi:hypothetical protein